MSVWGRVRLVNAKIAKGSKGRELKADGAKVMQRRREEGKLKSKDGCRATDAIPCIYRSCSRPCRSRRPHLHGTREVAGSHFFIDLA